MGGESKNTSGKSFIANNDIRRFKTRTQSRDALSQFEDPTYLGFKLFFKGINDSNHGGLLGATDNPNSARFYLKQIGDNTRFKMLDTFVNMLQKINIEYPWYFQNISGLDEVWKQRTEIQKPVINGQLTIDCNESLDLRMSALIDLYRKAAYDWTNKREILTDNLRHFEMDVMVYDNREFMNSLQGESIGGAMPKDSSNAENINREFFGDSEFDYSQFMFHLSYVEINLESGANMFATINNASSEAAQQNIIFNYELVEESNLFKILTLLYRSDGEKFWYVKDYVNNIINTLAGSGTGGFNKSLLGGGNIVTSGPVESQSAVFNANKDNEINKPKQSEKIDELYSDNKPDDRKPKQSEKIDELYSDNKPADRKSNKLIEGIYSDKKDTLQKLKERAGNALENITDDFVTTLQRDTIGELSSIVTGELNTLFLGNVYEFSARTTLESGIRNKKIGSIIDKIF